jgi:hypothetical protein
MNEQTPPPSTPEPAATPSQPTQPAATPPPPPPPAADTEKASGGKRALGVLFVLILAFGAAVMFVAGAEINDTASCDDPAAVIESAQVDESGNLECFDGSSGLKSVVVGLMYASGAVGAIAVLIGLAFVFTGRRGRLFAQVAIAAVVLAGLSLLIGQL